MKKPGAWYYSYAPVLPHGLKLAVLLACFTCCDMPGYPFCISQKDILSSVLSGALYIFFDNLFCTVVKGVGLV